MRLHVLTAFVLLAGTPLAAQEAVTAKANDQGNYGAPYLIPGAYRPAAEAPGFKQTVRGNVELRVDDRITVTADTPVLETTNASLGQVIDAQRVATLPITRGNPYHLIQLLACRRARPQNPPPDIGIEGFERFGPANVLNGVARPASGPNAWVAELGDPKPRLTLAWERAQALHIEVLATHGAPAAIFEVRCYA